ncbi:lysozyme [Microlunatus elymi]|uniref:lysozyme n=1 Tax=Microlunatus elymi TaxID=2596828 RepID=A0A516PWF6_9ACTN|nr:lysozyme [Microlunatus elymi]QDP95472.1 lysozyme [Microlunatus elymi]
MQHAGRTTRRWLTAGAAALMMTLIAPAAISAAAPNRPNGSAGADHAMGSQIRKHEGSGAATRAVARPMAAASSVRGIDVSSWQGTVDWTAQWNAGKRFAWVKATEGTNYTNPYFTSQYGGSYKKGFIRGAYHFALPDKSSGATQAKYFSDHGGGWSADGKTLPGVVDLEYNPYGATCYGKTKAQMRTWIADFSNYYKKRWNKYPAIYTSTSWWSKCVNSSFSSTNALWVARYASTVGTLPYNWAYYTVWQYSSSPIDQNVFNGTTTQLRTFAANHD